MLDLRVSDTYQSILEEGRTEGRAQGRSEGRSEGRAEGWQEGRLQAERELLVLFGSKRFGEPSIIVRQTIEQVATENELKGLVNRVLDVQSWEELLQ